MMFGISGAPVRPGLPYAGFFNRVCELENFSPILTYSVSWREIIGEYGDTAAARLQDGFTDPSQECGHGLMQLDASWPDDWADPSSNIRYAIQNFLRPAVNYWHGMERFTGDTLVLLVAATFNEGVVAAEKYHALGDVDAGTSDEYGHGVLKIYNSLIATGSPQ